jgi:hypothetical protein
MMDRFAVLSDCGRYRYALARGWDKSLPRLGWVMLNPSIADADVDDPTIRKCIGFAKHFGYGAIHVVNIYPLRSTDPRGLRADDWDTQESRDINFLAWKQVASACNTVIAAWGAHDVHPMEEAAASAFLNLECLGRSKDGHPRHPLMLAYETAIESYARNGRLI